MVTQNHTHTYAIIPLCYCNPICVFCTELIYKTSSFNDTKHIISTLRIIRRIACVINVSFYYYENWIIIIVRRVDFERRGLPYSEYGVCLFMYGVCWYRYRYLHKKRYKNARLSTETDVLEYYGLRKWNQWLWNDRLLCKCGASEYRRIFYIFSKHN